MEVGLTTGQIAGFRYRNTNVPPLTIDDLHENYIVVSGHGIKQYLDASPELIERLKKFYKPNPRRRIFETISDNVRRRVRFAVARAGIKGARGITPDSLRFLLKPEAPKIVLNVGEFNSQDIIRAELMAQYYMANYCLENRIRRFIRETLSKHGENWWETKVPEKVRIAVKEKQEHELNSPLSERGDELEYTMFRELLAIIKENWLDFGAGMSKNLSVVERTLLDLNDLRNVIAHSSTLDQLGRQSYETSAKTWLGLQVKSESAERASKKGL